MILKADRFRYAFPLLGLVPSIISYAIFYGGFRQAVDYVLFTGAIIYFLMVEPGKVRQGFLLAVCLGCFVGLCVCVNTYLATGRTDVPAFAHDYFQEITPVLILALLPAVVSYTARRYYFWWGVLTLPISVGIGHVGSAEIMNIGLHVFNVIVSIAPVYLPVVLITAGSMSLVRYIVQRRRGSANISEDIAPVERADKEGAWPPPPAVK